MQGHSGAHVVQQLLCLRSLWLNNKEECVLHGITPSNGFAVQVGGVDVCELSCLLAFHTVKVLIRSSSAFVVGILWPGYQRRRR